MGAEHPIVLVTEASTLHFELYSRTQYMAHFSHNEVLGYRLVLEAKLEFPKHIIKEIKRK